MIAVLAAGGSTGLALLVHPERAFGAASLYLLGVVVAAALGGAVGGVSASVLCFLSLNYFFTVPRHTLRVANAEDIESLAVFLIVAVIVGSLLSQALAERARAGRSERQARLLSYFATKVMSGEPLANVLDDFAGSLLETMRLLRCEIHASAGERSVEARQERAGPSGGDVCVVPIRAGGKDLGTLTAERPSGAPLLNGDDRRLLEEAAKQIALALQRGSMDAQIARARTQAETNEARAALFSSVTHDLRTPLASIKASVTTLLQDDVALDDGQRRDLLITVLEETDRLNGLLGNLLELAKVRAGALVLAKEPTAVDEIIQSVLHRMAGRLSSVRIRTIVRDVPEVPVDPVQIDQVVTNLLENAVRFSPAGGEVLVSVGPWRGAVQVRIADQGPGIAPGDRTRVFEAFYRGDGDERSGSGLGLAIARAIVL
ncbi:MAG: DUF4118 domain-containing protein, partial [Actinomycetota bacterium]